MARSGVNALTVFATRETVRFTAVLSLFCEILFFFVAFREFPSFSDSGIETEQLIHFVQRLLFLSGVQTLLLYILRVPWRPGVNSSRAFIRAAWGSILGALMFLFVSVLMGMNISRVNERPVLLLSLLYGIKAFSPFSVTAGLAPSRWRYVLFSAKPRTFGERLHVSIFWSVTVSVWVSCALSIMDWAPWFIRFPLPQIYACSIGSTIGSIIGFVFGGFM